MNKVKYYIVWNEGGEGVVFDNYTDACTAAFGPDDFVYSTLAGDFHELFKDEEFRIQEVYIERE